MRCAILLALTILPAAGQLLRPPLSPVVHDDGSLSLALKAPAADSVKAAIYLGETFDMRRGADGIWRVDIGPLEPGVYYYTFEVDGTARSDPANSNQLVGLQANVHSYVLIPAEEPAFYEVRDVPRGVIHHHWHRSRVLGDHRGYVVYTPPGYVVDATHRYPVLYLLSGYGGTEADWSRHGGAQVILDNLIAAGAVEPMLVVMPHGMVSAEESRGDTSWMAWMQRLTPRVGEYLVDELVPLVDGSYRTVADGGHRALAGLSMGGGQTLYIGLRNPQTFSALGAFSAAGVFPPAYGWMLDGTTGSQLSLLWIRCGTEDFLYEANAGFVAELQRRGIAHEAEFPPGGHGWFFWQHCLRDFAGRLFR